MKISCDKCNATVINGVPCHETGCPGHFICLKRGKPFLRVRFWSLDVLGNAHDGFEVNDRSSIGSTYLPKDFGLREVVQALKFLSQINPRNHVASYTLDGDDMVGYLNQAKTYMPLFEFEVQ